MKVWIICFEKTNKFYPLGAGGGHAAYRDKKHAEKSKRLIEKHDKEYLASRGKLTIKAIIANQEFLKQLRLGIV